MFYIITIPINTFLPMFGKFIFLSKIQLWLVTYIPWLLFLPLYQRKKIYIKNFFNKLKTSQSHGLRSRLNTGCERTSNFNVVNINCVSSTVLDPMSCNSMIHGLNLPFRRILMFVCNFMRVSTYRAAFIVVSMGIHLTSMDPETSKKSVNITFQVDFWLCFFLCVGWIFVLPCQEDGLLVDIWQ